MASRDSGLLNAITLQAGFTEAASEGCGGGLRVGVAFLSSVPVGLPVNRVEVAMPAYTSLTIPGPVTRKRQCMCSYGHHGICHRCNQRRPYYPPSIIICRAPSSVETLQEAVFQLLLDPLSYFIRRIVPLPCCAGAPRGQAEPLHSRRRSRQLGRRRACAPGAAAGTCPPRRHWRPPH